MGGVCATSSGVTIKFGSEDTTMVLARHAAYQLCKTEEEKNNFRYSDDPDIPESSEVAKKRKEYLQDPQIRAIYMGSILQRYAHLGDLKMVQASVTTGGVDPDWTCKEVSWQLALALAAEHDHVDVVNFLIAAGADVNKRGNPLGVTAAYQAAGFNSVRSLQSLADAGADMNLGSSSNGSTPLLIATEANSIAAVKVLVAAGAELNRTNDNGSSPLLLAAELGLVEIVEILLQAGADTNVLGTYIAMTLFKTAVVAAIRNHLAETASMGAQRAPQACDRSTDRPQHVPREPASRVAELTLPDPIRFAPAAQYDPRAAAASDRTGVLLLVAAVILAVVLRGGL